MATVQPDELPVHAVRIRSGFWLARTEVTNAQYEKRMKPTTARRRRGTGSAPGGRHGLEEAKAYCAAIGGRLPTEAEWEYAARGGSRERYYDTLSEMAWYEANSDDHSHPVGQKAPNAFGLYDMLGNVYEWVLDRYYNKYDDSHRGDRGAAALERVGRDAWRRLALGGQERSGEQPLRRCAAGLRRPRHSASAAR